MTNVALSDGPLDPARWNSAPVRVLHLLKEPVESQWLARMKREGSASDSLTALFMRDLDPSLTRTRKILPVCARRGFLVQQGPHADRFRDWVRIRSVLPAALADSCRQQAVVNIKKTLGKSTSGSLKRWAGPELIEEILAYDPTHVLCGGTWRYVAPRLSGTRQAANGAHWLRDAGVTWVECQHPTVRVGEWVDFTWFAAGALDAESGWLGAD